MSSSWVDHVPFSIPLIADDDGEGLVGDSHMDIGDKDSRVSGLQLNQLHLHGPSSGTLAGGTAAGTLDEVAADEVVLKFECQMYKVKFLERLFVSFIPN